MQLKYLNQCIVYGFCSTPNRRQIKKVGYNVLTGIYEDYVLLCQKTTNQCKEQMYAGAHQHY